MYRWLHVLDSREHAFRASANWSDSRMIGYISTKLLLIGIIKNYNRGSFNLAVISFVPASIHIVPLGSEYMHGTRSVGTITAPDRGLVATR